jgi:glucans biosynthesis protein
VTINVVDGKQSRQILYSDGLFEAPPENPMHRLPRNLGFAGFRVLNRDGAGDWLAFLGASYFRSAKPFNQYGLSMRGLAIDTATSRVEEFPNFTEFWLGHDAEGNLVIHALLEGPSVVGAYRFSQKVTESGLTQDVDAGLNFRAPIDSLGIAPLTSMFWYGRSDRRQAIDWRPQIHDSDGLAISTGTGERIWRPLANPPAVLTNTYLDTHPRGFGLMQRDRNFEDYQDDGAFYNRRPSLWVEPLGDWGAGSIQLVEIPTDVETADNIVSFWTPRRGVKSGDSLTVHYRLHWGAEEPDPPHIGQVVATRSGVGGRPGQSHEKALKKFVIDFAGGGLSRMSRQSSVRPNVVLSAGSPIGARAYPVVGTDRWRLVFDIALRPGQTVDMRAFLQLDGHALTETWIYQAFG